MFNKSDPNENKCPISKVISYYRNNVILLYVFYKGTRCLTTSIPCHIQKKKKPNASLLSLIHLKFIHSQPGNKQNTCKYDL